MSDYVLQAPCVFCRYNGAGYWQTHTHSIKCPWYDVGSMHDRMTSLRVMIEDVHRCLLSALDFIDNSPCDPDVNSDQISSHRAYMEARSKLVYIK